MITQPISSLWPHSPRVAATKASPTVLFIDDDSSVRNSVCRVLVSEGLRVVAARGAKDALDYIVRNTPDLVVTDLCMAPLTGWDLIMHFRSRHPALPIFVITALPLRDAGIAKSVADGFFQKPLDLDVLLAAIRRQLGGPRLGQGFSTARS